MSFCFCIVFAWLWGENAPACYFMGPIPLKNQNPATCPSLKNQMAPMVEKNLGLKNLGIPRIPRETLGSNRRMPGGSWELVGWQDAPLPNQRSRHWDLIL